MSRFTDGNGLSYNCFRPTDVSFYLSGNHEKGG